MRELKADPSVERVEIDQWMVPLGERAPAFVPNDPDYAKRQWNFFNAKSGVHAPEAWTRAQGEGVVVAVVDTGVAQGNPDLQANLLPGYDMITDRLASRRDTDGRVPGGWDQGDWVEANYCTQVGLDPHPAENSGWHGTHVAGTIAQQTNNGLGLAGLAYKAKVLPVRVLGSCGGLISDIADGIVWAAGGEVPGMPVNPNPAEIINLSLGSRVPSECPALYQEALDAAVVKGAIIVAAAGNSNDNADIHTMGSCNNLILVAATNSDAYKAGFSNFGSRVALSAPGGGQPGKGTESNTPDDYIWQMINGGKTRPEAGNWLAEGYAGTSMAAPHVAAAAAMIQSVAETPLTWTQMRDLLQRTATLIVPIPGGPTPPDGKVSGMGAGILNIDAALVALSDPPCDPAKDDCGGPVLVPVPLTNKVEVNGLRGFKDGEALYSYKAEAGKVLSFMSYGGTGDVSMYVSLDKVPTRSAADGRSTRSGTNIETVRFTTPKAGTYFVKLIGTGNNGYSGATLVARQ